MRPIQHAMPGALVELLRLAPLSAGKVDFAWRVAVGPVVERVTAVRLEDRVLLVDASSKAWAREITRSAPMILGRVRTLLGADAVARITVREP